ncbi:Peroxidase 47 [Hibiscus trionum]|uniref:peroxidase n=1 Tax=Hibiscus trionum TaxID=183268 RepID=A0A9W7MA83_HIBTR|nr:Peroxidase 47 [Hibiscus trionum]
MAMLLVMVVILIGIGGANGLRMDYYITSCPFAESIVKNTVNKALQNEPTLAAALLRMHFHDCFVEGCDGSILIDSTRDNTAEKDSPANLSLRGFEVIDDAKEQLEEQCPGIVSCADVVAMAARDAIFWAGGPIYDIPKGRKDGRRSKIEDTINLPSPSFNTSQLINAFGQRGFTTADMVALSGAHTLGVARCSFFKGRLSNQDPTLDPDFAKELSKTCDQVLYSTTATRAIVNGYAINLARFFLDFQQAMLKMGRLDVKEGPKGEVRKNCRKIN